MSADKREGPVKTANRVFHILESIRELDGAGVSELADYTDLPKSTVHNYLKTMYEIGYLSKENGEYDISNKFIQFGQYAKYSIKGITYIEKKVEEIADKTGERVQFVSEENGVNYYIITAQGENAVNITGAEVGNYFEDVYHASSAGKAIFAFSSQEKVERTVTQRGLPDLTKHSITEYEALQQEFETIRNQGFALNDEEMFEGLRAVAVPILDPDETPIGAISVSGPSRRLDGDRLQTELPELLLGIANEIELNIAHGE